ncbi:MAG: GFA family protein [Proteobacteria bacterium]|nr:GFA family protein [Pseudomonadota bacterium]
MPAPYAGGCQCGELRFNLTAEPLTAYRCHCSECRRHSGSAFGTSVIVPRRAFSLIQGRPRSWDRTADSGGVNESHFCANCGTRVYGERKNVEVDFVVLRHGSFDDPSSIKPIGDIWTKRALPWVVMDQDLIQIESQPTPTEMSAMVERFQAVSGTG